MSCGCNRPGHGPEPHSPVPLHAPLPSHSAIPLKGGSVFSNVIDHLKRQIDRLFKGKADLVDGKVPDDQLPERPAATVAWDDVKGKPTEFPPAEHGHPDIAGSVEGLRTTKADATEVTVLGARVGAAEAGIEGLRGSLGAMEQTVDGADMRSQNAYAQARDAVGKAEAATLSAGNAYTTAMAADSKATTAKSIAEAADSRATAAKSIAEDAQVSADDAVGYAELAVSTAESKLDSDGTAADSAKLGGVDASEYARKTDVPSRLKNDTDTVRCDGEGNIYSIVDGAGGYLTRGTEIFAKCAKNGDTFTWTSTTNASNTLAYSTSGLLTYGGRSVVKSELAGRDPLNGDSLGTFNFYNDVFTHTPLGHTPTESATPIDRFARESQVEEGLTPLAEGSLAGINDYLLNDCVIISGVAVLSRDAVNRIDMSGVSSIALQYPTETGRVRDFVVVFDNVSGSPNIDFGTIEIVTDDASVLEVGAGTNVMSFTEISAGRFMVSRRVVEEVA